MLLARGPAIPGRPTLAFASRRLADSVPAGVPDAPRP